MYTNKTLLIAINIFSISVNMKLSVPGWKSVHMIYYYLLFVYCIIWKSKEISQLKATEPNKSPKRRSLATFLILSIISENFVCCWHYYITFYPINYFQDGTFLHWTWLKLWSEQRYWIMTSRDSCGLIWRTWNHDDLFTFQISLLPIKRIELITVWLAPSKSCWNVWDEISGTSRKQVE